MVALASLHSAAPSNRPSLSYVPHPPTSASSSTTTADPLHKSFARTFFSQAVTRRRGALVPERSSVAGGVSRAVGDEGGGRMGRGAYFRVPALPLKGFFFVDCFQRRRPSLPCLPSSPRMKPPSASLSQSTSPPILHPPPPTPPPPPVDTSQDG